MVDYICMYDVYKLSYRRPSFNSFVIIIQLTNFLNDNLFINTSYFQGDSFTLVVIPKG